MNTENFREPVFQGLISAVISAPIAYFVLDFHAVMTISVGQQGVVNEMIRDGAIASGFAGFFAGFFSSYFSRNKVLKS